MRDIILNANAITDAKFPESFRNGSRRLAISLANNHLQSVTNITFRSLGNVTLTHLHLSNNNISDVPSGLFEDVSVIESLRLKNNPLTTSALKNVATGLTGRSLNDLDLSGVFRPGDDIQAVIASFEIIPLKTLKLRSNSISILTQNMFVKLNHLLELDLAQNKVLSSFYSTFNGLTNLLTLNLFDNSLQFVPKHLPSSLVTLYLNKNKIQTIKRNTFKSAPNLKRLILRDNQIRNLQQRAFSGLTNLQELDLAVNHIVQLPVKIFRPLQNLTFLDLRGNNLKYIYSKSPFESLVSLRVLHFEDNECSVLPKNVFKSMKSLTSLHLNGNNLSVILSGTKEVLLFEGLNKLEDIYIASNHLSTLPEYIFRHQTSLDILHMENNKISILNSKLFRFTKKLKSLDLSSNKIKVINKENVYYLKNLYYLYLNYNPFMCDCELLWFREWIDQTKISLPSKQSFRCFGPKEWNGKSLLEFDKNKINCTRVYVNKYIIAGAVIMSLIPFFIAFLAYKNRWQL